MWRAEGGGGESASSEGGWKRASARKERDGRGKGEEALLMVGESEPDLAANEDPCSSKECIEERSFPTRRPDLQSRVWPRTRKLQA